MFWKYVRRLRTESSFSDILLREVELKADLIAFYRKDQIARAAVTGKVGKISV